MYPFNINTLKQIQAYRDISTGTNYIRIDYVTLDNVNQYLIYSSALNQYSTKDITDDNPNPPMNEFDVKFSTLLTLVYDLFDYVDRRNDFYKIMYKFNIDHNRRSYFQSTFIDYNFKTHYTVQLPEYIKHRFIHNLDIEIEKVSTFQDDVYGLDSDGNEVIIDPINLKILSTFKFNYPDMIFDNSKVFEINTIEINGKRQFKDYNAKINEKQLTIYLEDVTSDDLDSVKTAATDHPELPINLLINKPASELSDDIKDKINTETTLYSNVSIYLQIDTDSMNIDLDTVLNNIDDIYEIFGSRIDGILLTNIAELSDDASDDEKAAYYNYYMTIKNYAHNNTTSDKKGSTRYYIIGKMDTDNVVPLYTQGRWNNPVDEIIQYIGDQPVEVSQLGDAVYSDYKHVIIKNVDLSQMTDDEIIEYVEKYLIYCKSIYITEKADFSSITANMKELLTDFNNYKPTQYVYVRPI